MQVVIPGLKRGLESPLDTYAGASTAGHPELLKCLSVAGPRARQTFSFIPNAVRGQKCAFHQSPGVPGL